MNKNLQVCGILFLLVLFVVMFAFLITGIVYMTMYGYIMEINQYSEHNCTLNNGTVAKYDYLDTCFGIYYIPLWKVTVPDFNTTIYSATTNLLDLMKTSEEVYEKMKKYQQNSTMKCYCKSDMGNGNVYPNFRNSDGCQVLAYCFADVEFMKTSLNNEYYYNLGTILGLIGGIALATKLIILLPFWLFVSSDCGKNRKQYITV